MPSTEVQLVSGALSYLGKKPISSLGQDDLSITAQVTLERILKTRISQGFWRFCTKIVQLAQSVNVPPVSNWQSIYLLPGDFEKLVRLYPQTWAFEIYDQSQMYINFTGTLFLEYTYVPLITALPDWFTEYLITEVAHILSLSSAQYAQFEPVIRQARDIEKALAMAADAQNRPQTPLMSSPVISNRFVGTWIGG